MCNNIFSAYCDIFLDDENKCSKLNMCLTQVLGVEEMMRRCKHVGLDKEYEKEWKELSDRYEMQNL